jgi:hypothetical protein
MVDADLLCKTSNKANLTVMIWCDLIEVEHGFHLVFFLLARVFAINPRIPF